MSDLHGLSTADQCRKLGIKVGDTIVGRECYRYGWSEAQLTLLWLGDEVAVWSVQERYDDRQEWCEPEESATWNLGFREWKKVETPELKPCERPE